MKRVTSRYVRTDMYSIPTYEGETIEMKVARVVENNEAITDGAPIIYTEKKDGVKPEFDIRTDRFDIALDAMDKVAASEIAKSENAVPPQEEPEPKPEEPTA